MLCRSNISLTISALVWFAGLACSPALKAQRADVQREWLSKARIAAYSLGATNARRIVDEASASGVYGIEVDNDIEGRYDSFLDPKEKLEAIRRLAKEAHRVHNKAFVYVAGTECISVDAGGPHTLAKEHPDWLQRKRDGQPAIFNSKAAFWIRPNEEDVWLSFYAQSWRKLYMERIRQIAATGIDGIYVDIPYWMTHYAGWENSWASFDDATVAAFKAATGLDARKDIKLGDPDDPGFRKWIDFRIQTVNDFMADIRKNALSVNSNIAIIPEIYPGIEESAPRVGTDVYQLYPVVDAIAHEYEFGDAADHTAAGRTPFDWFLYQIGMRSFRSFAGPAKPTWILNYSWDDAPHVPAPSAMLSLASSELMAGANFWDASGHIMSGSNDMSTRNQIFHWIASHEEIFGAQRFSEGKIGVYFSDATRNYYPAEFVPSYQGVLLMLLQNHLQFQIVTPRTLGEFHGQVLVLPDVRVLNDKEASTIKTFASSGGRLVFTGNTNHQLDDLRDARRFPEQPELRYLACAQKNFYGVNPQSETQLLQALSADDKIEINASQNVVVHEAKIMDKMYLFFANFSGLQAGQNETPETQRGIRVKAQDALGNKLHWLPFLGTETVIQGESDGNSVTFTLPPLERGAIAWF
jgi:hypothetical protein